MEWHDHKYHRTIVYRLKVLCKTSNVLFTIYTIKHIASDGEFKSMDTLKYSAKIEEHKWNLLNRLQ